MNDSVLDKSGEKSKTLLIWDVEDLPKKTISKIVLCHSFIDNLSPNIVSIPALVEKFSLITTTYYRSSSSWKLS